MKKLLLLSIILATFASPAHAKTVQVFATDVLTTYGSFSETAGGSALADDATIETVITSDPATATAIYGSSPTDYSVIDLGFGDNNVLTGSGSDLVVFSLWQGQNYFFGLEAYGTDSSEGPLSSFYYEVIKDSVIYECTAKDDSDKCLAGIVTTSINLFGKDSLNLFSKDSLALDDNVEIGSIRLLIGGAYNGGTGGRDAYSNFTLVGANYTDSMVVPLPLPIVLFSSGLALLGLIARRKKV